MDQGLVSIRMNLWIVRNYRRHGLERIQSNQRLLTGGKRRNDPVTPPDINLRNRPPRQIREKLLQLSCSVLTGNSRRGRHKADILRRNAEGCHHPSQLQCQFSRLGTHVSVSLVQNNPAQRFLLSGDSYDGRIDLAHHYVFEHGAVGDQNRRRLRTHQLARQNFVRL
ncbi:Uncharacterised protein [Acinetobacter baumannii]|nr:Uncharacterised protein [Acinetobacter baumannii]